MQNRNFQKFNNEQGKRRVLIMRKQTKLVAVLSAAALLAIGASMTSFAASGWTDQDGTWVYLDKDGERVTETWKKSGNHYFWLDENGEMATNAVIEDGDDTYYVNEAGARVANQWVAVENNDVCSDMEADTVYFYFGSTGKAYKDTNTTNGKKTINGYTYIFDDEGHMKYGWQEYDNNLYYLGEENEGWAATGWQYLELDEDVIDSKENYDDEEWFWFDGSGKAARDKRKYIDKAYYTFDENGVMENKWVIGTPGAPESTSSAYYDEEVGNQKTGWVYVVPEGKDEGDEEWFYLSSKGVPFNENGADAQSDTYAATAIKVEFGHDVKDTYNNVAARVIKNKTYLFDENGAMLNGVYLLAQVRRVGGSSSLLGENGGIYYFNKGDGSVKGQMMTGKQTVTYDGDDYAYYFDSNGEAYLGALVDGSIYDGDGVRVESEDGNALFNVEMDIKDKKGKVVIPTGSQVIIGTSGKVKKSGTVTIDGIKYTVKDYVATEKPEN